ncbi:hypothetical protein Y695_03052 [Hydrogenophaga sp. T4]|nr:hypothetical protein Y695_03052 [Hydrogenophaga sp. T4]
MGLPPAIWELPARLGVPFDVTLHDHFFACPRVNLLDDQGQFCDQPPLERCEVCVQATELPPHVEPAFSEIGGTAQTWRVHHHRALKLARRIVAPCADTARRFQAAFPDLQARVLAHPEDPVGFLTPRFPGEGEVLRVAVIARSVRTKGTACFLTRPDMFAIARPPFASSSWAPPATTMPTSNTRRWTSLAGTGTKNCPVCCSACAATWPSSSATGPRPTATPSLRPGVQGCGPW